MSTSVIQDEDKQNKKHNAIFVGHHHTLTNTNNANKTYVIIHNNKWIRKQFFNLERVLCITLKGSHTNTHFLSFVLEGFPTKTYFYCLFENIEQAFALKRFWLGTYLHLYCFVLVQSITMDVFPTKTYVLMNVMWIRQRRHMDYLRDRHWVTINQFTIAIIKRIKGRLQYNWHEPLWKD